VSAAALFDRLPRFVRFLACGGFAAAVNWASRFAWNMVMPFSLAVLAAYVTGMVVAFILFREFVFERSSTDTSEQVRNFVIVNILGMAATWALANLLVYWALPSAGVTRHVEAIGHGIAIFAPVVTSWFGHRFLTFR
jgi:putative flippase GtrA